MLMKTLDIIKEEITSLEEHLLSHHSPSSFQYKDLLKKLKLYRTIQLYLERKPSERYLRETKMKLEQIVKSIYSQYWYWQTHCKPDGVDYAKEKAVFEELTGIKTLKKQIEVLGIILND